MPAVVRLLVLLLLSGPCAALASASAPPAPSMEDRVKPCAACHGEGGRSAAEAYYPSLAGKPADYLYKQLRRFRDGHRRNAVMANLLAPLSDDYLRQMARYYAQQSPSASLPSADADTPLRRRGRQLVEDGEPGRGLPACRDCHGANLAGVEPAIPGLIGLRAEYLSAQLGAWRNGLRVAEAPDCMARIARLLRPEDIKAVSTWLAALPRSASDRPAPAQAGPLPMPCGALP